VKVNRLPQYFEKVEEPFLSAVECTWRQWYSADRNTYSRATMDWAACLGRLDGFWKANKTNNLVSQQNWLKQEVEHLGLRSTGNKWDSSVWFSTQQVNYRLHISVFVRYLIKMGIQWS